jgi:peroxiredoxin
MKQDALRGKGVTEVIILAVNDGAVMMNWAKSQ